jgi:5-methyltetrahydropteroyltriglutamate--homocysteine methyltransferase
MRLFPTQEIGSLPKATPETIERWAARVRLGADAPELALSERRSRFNLAFLRAAGLDRVYDGEAHRIEMSEHPFRSIRGAEFVGHVRSFDNKYFRKAAVRAPVGLDHPYHRDEFRSVLATVGPEGAASLKVPVTGPYTLTEWTYNDYYLGRQPNRYGRAGRASAQRELILAIARDVLRPTLVDLIRLGARLIQIDEPALGTHPDETSLAVEGFETAVRGLDAEFTMHLCFSDYPRLLPAILEAKSCREWALEFANRDAPGHDAYALLAQLRQYGDPRRIGLGVVDVHRDEIETAELVTDRILRASRHLGDPTRLRVNPDCGLRTRSWDVIWAKLSRMTEGAERARRSIGSA